MAKSDESKNISADTASAVTALTFDQLKELLSVSGERSDDRALQVLSDRLSDLVAAQNRQASATEQTVRRSNATHPGVSVFNEDGERDHPKEKLKNFVFMEGHECQDEQLTPLEIRMLNQISSTREARKGMWRAEVQPSIGGGKGAVNIRLGVRNHDDLVGLPSLIQIATELATGSEASDVHKLYERLAQMSAELDQLKARQDENQTAVTL